MTAGTEIGVTDLRDLIVRGARIELVDVREPWEHDICLIEGSLKIPLAELPDRVAELSDDSVLVMICHHGMRSAHAMRWLRSQGHVMAVNLSGGIDAWACQIDPGMPRY